MSDAPLRIWLAVPPGAGATDAVVYEHEPSWSDRPTAAADWSVLDPYVLEAQTTARHLPVLGEVD